MTTPLAYLRVNALNAICPYFTMFPLEYPVRIIGKHKRELPVVVDPFCGRGTTLFAARSAGLSSYGLDTSPIAVAIARAKLASAPLGAVLDLARGFLQIDPQSVPDQPFFRWAYAPNTLRALCSLREGLLGVKEETDEAALLRAAALGCLHGPRPKVISNAGYFSNQMPRTFSTKPEYSVRFWRKRGMNPPEVSVLDVLHRKLQRIPDLDKPTLGGICRVQCADARQAGSYQQLEGRLLVVTSPPYYGMKTYIQDQWLRSWFLGGPSELSYAADLQLRHSSHSDFSGDLGSVWTNLRRVASRVDLYVRFGTINSVKSDARELFKASLAASGGWQHVSTRRAKTASHGKRQADQMQPDSSAAQEFDFHAVAA